MDAWMRESCWLWPPLRGVTRHMEGETPFPVLVSADGRPYPANMGKQSDRSQLEFLGRLGLRYHNERDLAECFRPFP